MTNVMPVYGCLKLKDNRLGRLMSQIEKVVHFNTTDSGGG